MDVNLIGVLDCERTSRKLHKCKKIGRMLTLVFIRWGKFTSSASAFTDSVGAKTLEEIMEETSAAASEVRREDAGVSPMSDKGCGVDPSRDLSSDGKYELFIFFKAKPFLWITIGITFNSENVLDSGSRSQSTTSDSAIQTVEKTPAGPDSSQLAGMGFACRNDLFGFFL